MPDLADMAQELIEMREAERLAAIPRFSGVSAVECIHCGDRIPEARRVAIPGVQACVACAEVEEKRNKFSR